MVKNARLKFTGGLIAAAICCNTNSYNNKAVDNLC